MFQVVPPAQETDSVDRLALPGVRPPTRILHLGHYRREPRRNDMNLRDLNLNDRERRLRLAIESLKRRTPKGQKPPDAVVPAWESQGGMICPKCGGRCVAPIAWNPWNSLDEKMVLVPGKCNNCPHQGCGAVHFVTEELAEVHNAFWYPEDYPVPREPKREDG
jgi:hypothetical protein